MKKFFKDEAVLCHYNDTVSRWRMSRNLAKIVAEEAAAEVGKRGRQVFAKTPGREATESSGKAVADDAGIDASDKRSE
jgi:hypothetical protein